MSAALATAIAEVFTEVVVAPAYEDGAVEVLTARRTCGCSRRRRPRSGRALDYARIDGGFLVQELDTTVVDRTAWQVVTKAAPTEEQWADPSSPTSSAPT